MRRAILLFGAIGGLGVPLVLTLASWMLRSYAPDAGGVIALLRDVRLPLWPMSRLFDDDPAGRHWLYLPLAAILSNMLIYAVVGILSAWGRTNRAAFVAAMAVAMGLLFVAQWSFGTSRIGLAIAAALALIGLLLHHRAPPVSS